MKRRSGAAVLSGRTLGRVIWLLCVLLCPAASPADENRPSAGAPEAYLARLQTLALLETLNAELLSHDSATRTLENWCAVHHLAEPATIRAERVSGADQAPTAAERHDLEVTAAELVRYRRVRLVCGTVVLSEAENWYVPGRLTARMNRLLETTDMPFGIVVQPLQFQRHTLSAQLLWHPLPDGWEMGAAAAVDEASLPPPPNGVIEHRAVLSLPDGTPFSELVETYTRHVLDFPLRGPR